MAHPFILYGDSPALPSGLGRILRDVASRLVAYEERLGITVATVGISEPHGLDWAAWPHFRFQPTWQDQGEAEVGRAIAFLKLQGAEETPIVLVLYDPSRAYALIQAREQEQIPKETQIWGYFPIDGHPVDSFIGGPAGAMIQQVDRCLAYGRYGAGILKNTRGKGVSYLPHGIEPGSWPMSLPVDLEADLGFRLWREALDPTTVVIGVVATNQPRKDFPMVFEAMIPLQERLGVPIALWIHSDIMTKYWDFGELARIYKLLQGHVFVSVSRGDQHAGGEVLSDLDLARRYTASHLTVAPGLGEGFGYPIMESLLCGTPVVHVAYAGGTELIPDPRGLVLPKSLRAEGIYAIQRPVVEVQEVVDACARLLEAPPNRPALRGAALWYSWEHVWPGWEKWIARGIEEFKG